MDQDERAIAALRRDVAAWRAFAHAAVHRLAEAHKENEALRRVVRCRVFEAGAREQEPSE